MVDVGLILHRYSPIFMLSNVLTRSLLNYGNYRLQDDKINQIRSDNKII